MTANGHAWIRTAKSEAAKEAAPKINTTTFPNIAVSCRAIGAQQKYLLTGCYTSVNSANRNRKQNMARHAVPEKTVPISIEEARELFERRRAAWLASDAEAYLAKFGDKVPPRLKTQLEALKTRLG